MASALLLLESSANAQTSSSEEPYWTPDQAVIAKLEAGLKIGGLPKQAHYELTQYDRYYAGITANGQRRVRGRLILPPDREDSPKTGIHFTDTKYLPQLRGGGCANVYVTYIVDKDLSFGQCDLTRILGLSKREVGMHLASEWDNGPMISDGRCSNIDVVYDVNSAKLKRCASANSGSGRLCGCSKVSSSKARPR